MNRFFLITFQWSTDTGLSTRTLHGDTPSTNDTDAFRGILTGAQNSGVPANANVIAFHLEAAK